MPRQRAKERACEKAIKRTLAYRSTFKYPLSFYQLSTYLISKKGFEYDFFNKILRRHLKNKSVRIKKGAYYLPSTRPVSWETRMEHSLDLYQKNGYIFKLLSTIPWIKMIAVTGALASHNTTDKDDIDILIVTEKNRLWISRLFLVLILKMIHKYPTKQGESGKICPNIMLDEQNMAWEKKKRNIYTANEILLMQPVYQKDNTYFKFVQANSWAMKYFPNWKITFPKETHKVIKRSTLIDRLEKKVRELQQKYMESKRTSEITQPGFIHFNIKDSTRRVLRNYSKQLKKLDIKE